MGRKSSGIFVDIICMFTTAMKEAQQNEIDARKVVLVRECEGEGRTTGVSVEEYGRMISVELFRYRLGKERKVQTKKTR